MRIVSLALLVACHSAPPPRAGFVGLGPADAAMVSTAADAVVAAPHDPLAHDRFVRDCLHAGARAECDKFYTSLADPSIGLALLALAFGDATAATARLQSPDDTPPLRSLLAVRLARFSADNDDLERARAALAVAEPSADKDLATVAISIADGSFADASLRLRALAESNAPLSAEQRDSLVQLGTRLSDRAATQNHEAVDAARRELSELEKLSAEEAIVRADAALKIAPNASLLWMVDGFARLKALDEPGAVAAFERAKELCPFDPEADFQLARLHERQGRYTRAVDFLQRGVDAAPVWSKGLWKLSDLALLAHEPKIATRALQRLKRLYPEDLSVDLGRARALLDEDQGAQALAVLKESARAHPSDLRPEVALAKTAFQLHASAASEEARRSLLNEAEHAITAAEALGQSPTEVEGLSRQLRELKGKM